MNQPTNHVNQWIMPPPPLYACVLYVCVVRMVPGRDVSPEVRNHLANVLCRQLKLTTEVLYYCT